MELIYLLFLFLCALVFTWLFTMVIGNRGPWNNPMFFFLVLFLTSWTLLLYMGPCMDVRDQLDYLYGAGITAIIALLLVASETPTPEPEPLTNVKSITRIRKFQWVSKSNGRPALIRPNAFFWILLAIESCMIIAAYFIQYRQNQEI